MGVKVMLDEFNIIKRKKKKNAFVSTALLITIGIAILVIILVVLLLGKKNNNKCETNTCSGNGNTALTEFKFPNLKKFIFISSRKNPLLLFIFNYIQCFFIFIQ